MKKGIKKETRHLVSPNEDCSTTLCGRETSKVLLWAKKGAPKDDDPTVCTRCLKGRKVRAEAAKKAGKITRGGKPIGKELERAIDKESKAMAAEALEGAAKFITDVPYSAPPKPRTRKFALAFLGENCPGTLYAKFKGENYQAEVTELGEIILWAHGAVKGGNFTSPSGAAMAITGKPVDGWTFWKYEKADGTREAINLLRPEQHRFVPKKKAVA